MSKALDLFLKPAAPAVGALFVLFWIMFGLLVDCRKNSVYACLFLGTALLMCYNILKLFTGKEEELSVSTLEPSTPKVPKRKGYGCGAICVAFSLGLLTLLMFIVLFASAAEASASTVDDAFDPALSTLVFLACASVLVWAQLALKGAVYRPAALRASCGGVTCAVFIMPLFVMFAALLTWHTAAKAGTALAPPLGVRIPVLLPGASHPVGVHVYCTGGGGLANSNSTVPTVLFLHGITGSGLDAEWVRLNADVVATGARFCSVDRPGYGWSDSYDATMREVRPTLTRPPPLPAYRSSISRTQSSGFWYRRGIDVLSARAAPGTDIRLADPSGSHVPLSRRLPRGCLCRRARRRPDTRLLHRRCLAD